ncbi:CAAX protease self-immunity-domain containing protein [Nitzschia inconspicua]|uniref:CAAX protease self-immunity-domain containing protein n=1 Tax=Nitzschia inconspicua TaxID=303405 RepID=A0A9K3K7A0_9STRA|nr:CAAX protease self-immunity-domain containing protein [Nitzschia inconspicua]KAG7344457.1 CAAX protease self-immunity-domain containing protein [Nitzschia inconspicua]
MPQQATVPPFIPLFLAATVNVTKIQSRWWRCSWKTLVLLEVSFALIIYLLLLPNSSIVPWWGPVTSLLSQWYRMDVLRTPFSVLLQAQGPLGTGAYKVIQVVVAAGLLRLFEGKWPFIQVGPLPCPLAWTVVIAISLAVNGVLHVWSRTTQSRGTHHGVDQMVKSSLQRSLTVHESVYYAMMAFINAVCEEVTFRWFWWQEFEVFYGDSITANIAQATIFGIWHYHGIPSGMAGVVLTFVYGWMMGELKERLGGGGLLLPILAHTLADYYIFTSIARGKATRAAAKNE